VKKVKCSYCEKTVNAKIIKHWKKRVTFEDPCDGQFTGCGHLDGVYTVQYQQLLVLHHKRGMILNRHKCHGSSKRKIIKWIIGHKHIKF